MNQKSSRVTLREIGESVLSLMLGLLFLFSLAIIALLMENIR